MFLVSSQCLKIILLILLTIKILFGLNDKTLKNILEIKTSMADLLEEIYEVESEHFLEDDFQ